MDKANGRRVGDPTAGRDRVSCERCQGGSARGAAGDQPRVKSNGCRESKARKSGSCKYGPLSAVRAEGYTQFRGSIRPTNRVERTRTNMSVGHAMKPMSEAHFA